MKSTFSPDHYDAKCSWWIKLEAGSICGDDSRFQLACLFWPVVCNLRGHGLNCKVLSRDQSIFLCGDISLCGHTPLSVFVTNLRYPLPRWCRFRIAPWALHKKTIHPGIPLLTIQGFGHLSCLFKCFKSFPLQSLFFLLASISLSLSFFQLPNAFLGVFFAKLFLVLSLTLFFLLRTSKTGP